MKKIHNRSVFMRSVLTASLFLTTSIQSVSAQGLVEVYQQAFKKSDTLRQADLDYQTSQKGFVAVEANLYPQISATVSAKKNRVDGIDSDTQNASINLEQALYSQGLNAAVSKQELLLTQSEVAGQKIEQQFVLEVAKQYFALLLAQSNVDLITSQVEADQKQFETIKASVDVGLSSMVDLLQAQATLDSSFSDQIQAQNQLSNAQEAFTDLTGSKNFMLNRVGLDTQFSYDWAQLKQRLDQVTETNLDVINQRLSFEASQQELNIKKAQRLPVISASASIGYGDVSGFNDKVDSQSIGINVTMPLYTGGQNRAEIAAAQLGVEKTKSVLSAQKDSASLKARQIYRDLEQGQALIHARKQAVNSAELFLEAAQESFNVGLQELLDVLNARKNLFQARLSLIEVLHTQALTSLEYEFELGDLTVQDLHRMDAYLVAH
jgi:outer membrane protein